MAFFGQLFKSSSDQAAVDAGPSSIRRSHTEGAAQLSDAANRVRGASFVEMAEYDEEELLKLSPADLVEKLLSAEQARDAAVANMMDSVSNQEQDRLRIEQLESDKETAEKQLQEWKMHAAQVANVVQAVRDTFDELAKAAQATTPSSSEKPGEGSEQPAAFLGSKGSVTTVNRLSGAGSGSRKPNSATGVDTSDPSCLGDVCAALIEVKIHLANMAFNKESASAGLARRMQTALAAASQAQAAEAAAKAATDDVTTQLLNLKMQNTNLHEQLAAAEIENRALEETATKARVELLRAKRKSVAVASKYGTWGAGVASGARGASGASGSPLNKTSALGLTMDEYPALHGGGVEGGSPEPLGSISDTEGGDDDEEGGGRSSRGHSGGDDSVLSVASTGRSSSDAPGSAQRSVRFGATSAFEGGSADAEGGGHADTSLRKSVSTPPGPASSDAPTTPRSPRGSFMRSGSMRLLRNKRHSALPSSGNSLPVPIVTDSEVGTPTGAASPAPSDTATPPAEHPSSLGGGERKRVSHLSLKRAKAGRGRGRGRGGHKTSYSTLPKGFNVNDFLASAAAAEGEEAPPSLAEGGDGESIASLSPAAPHTAAAAERTPASPAAGGGAPAPVEGGCRGGRATSRRVACWQHARRTRCTCASHRSNSAVLKSAAQGTSHSCSQNGKHAVREPRCRVQWAGRGGRCVEATAGEPQPCTPPCSAGGGW